MQNLKEARELQQELRIVSRLAASTAGQISIMCNDGKRRFHAYHTCTQCGRRKLMRINRLKEMKTGFCTKCYVGRRPEHVVVTNSRGHKLAHIYRECVQCGKRRLVQLKSKARFCLPCGSANNPRNKGKVGKRKITVHAKTARKRLTPEERRAYKNQWFRANREANPEKYREQVRKYRSREENKVKARAYMHAYVAANADKYRAIWRKSARKRYSEKSSYRKLWRFGLVGSESHKKLVAAMNNIRHIQSSLMETSSNES